jgi:hypothetical protein
MLLAAMIRPIELIVIASTSPRATKVQASPIDATPEPRQTNGDSHDDTFDVQDLDLPRRHGGRERGSLGHRRRCSGRKRVPRLPPLSVAYRTHTYRPLQAIHALLQLSAHALRAHYSATLNDTNAA